MAQTATIVNHQCTQNPLPVPVAVTAESSDYVWTDGEITISIAGVPADTTRAVSIQVAEADTWLLYCWFIDGDTITENETLTPPATPGVSNFYRITDTAGLATFSIVNTPAWSGRLCAVLVGKVAQSDAIVLGV